MKNHPLITPMMLIFEVLKVKVKRFLFLSPLSFSLLTSTFAVSCFNPFTAILSKQAFTMLKETVNILSGTVIIFIIKIVKKAVTGCKVYKSPV